MTLAAGRLVLTIAFCCAITTVFTACGDEDDDNNTAEIKGIAARYLFSVDEQMAQLCDYTMTYYGINGELTTEQATWTMKDGTATWMKDVSSTEVQSLRGGYFDYGGSDEDYDEGAR
ncbi:MAG: hypothetical protein IJT97_04900 [Bacteroidaceae bacterium]|nr:hypothetical protein [Bacteroidaceae bacterium]